MNKITLEALKMADELEESDNWKDVAQMLRHQHAEIERLYQLNGSLCEKANAYIVQSARDAEAIEHMTSELAEWQKLKDPVTLHANLLRGFPAKLDAAAYLHMGGHDQTVDALTSERDALNADKLTGFRIAHALTLETQTVEEMAADLVRQVLEARAERDALQASESRANAVEKTLRHLLAVRVGMPNTYYDDGEAQGQEHGITIDFMRDPVSDIDAKLRALNVKRAMSGKLI